MRAGVAVHTLGERELWHSFKRIVFDLERRPPPILSFLGRAIISSQPQSSDTCSRDPRGPPRSMYYRTHMGS